MDLALVCSSYSLSPLDTSFFSPGRQQLFVLSICVDAGVEELAALQLFLSGLLRLGFPN